MADKTNKEDDEKTLKGFKKFLKLDKKECSTVKMCMVNIRIGLYNAKHGTSHSISWLQKGQSDNYIWEINQSWNTEGVQATLAL